MRRLTTIIIAGAALLLSGCVIDDGTPKKYQVIATQLWEASRSDLNRINDILELMLDVETLLSIEDATERETFQHNQFRSSTIYYDNNVIRIVTPTKYGTSYTTTITTNGRTLAEGGTWSILRTGGWEYRLEAKGQNGKVIVDVSDLYHNESHGTASVELSYDYSGLGSALCITYTCSMTMSDTDKSVLDAEMKFKLKEDDPLFETFGGYWVDLQKLFGKVMNLRKSMGLANALGVLEATFSGTEHGALADAENTARILKTLRDKDAVSKLKARTNVTFNKPTTSSGGFTLGNLFAEQFSKLSFNEDE